MKGQWIREPQARTSAVFVHGILSTGEKCWRHDNGSYWPELLIGNPDLESLGIYVFTYQTGIFSGTYRLGDVVDALKEQLRLDKVLEKSDQLIFVCHSMGGIVVRKFILERQAELIEAEKEIDLFLIASPSLGSSYADWLWPFAKLFGHSQAEVLRFVQHNDWLKDLDKEFLNLKESGKLKIKGKELVEDKKLLIKQVVEPFSGARYFAESFKVPGSDHFSIAKPENSTKLQHRLLCQFIEDAMELSVSDLSQAVESSASWREQIVNTRNNGKEQQAARLLEAAGSLVAALSVLDNSIRATFSKIRLSAARLSELTDQERRQILEEINVFVIKEKILKTIRVSLANLQGTKTENIIEDKEIVEEIIHCAHQMMLAVDTGFSPFMNREQFYEFLKIFEESGASDQQKGILREMCDNILDVYDRKIVSQSQIALGQLSAQVMNKYPLPNPEWLKMVPRAKENT